MSISDDMERVNKIREMHADGYYFDTFNAGLDRQIASLLREIDRRDGLLGKMRGKLNAWRGRVIGPGDDHQAVLTLSLIGSLVHEAIIGPACLCDDVQDGMKFVDRNHCPRHGIPGQRFGEDGYVEAN